VIHVAAASSLEYLPWCATMIRSCLDQHSAELLHFHFLDAVGLPVDDRDQLREMVEREGAALTVHTVDLDRIAAFPPHARFGGHVVWLRLLLPDLLPALDRVLYLDADTFVVDSLEPLWATSLDGAPLGAVPNVVEPAKWAHLTSLGIADPRDVLNSGVLLLDLEALRAERAFEQLARYVAAEGSRLTWADQDALNVIFDGRWHHLHPRWNAQNSLWTWGEWATEVFGAERLAEATTSPAIVHFEGPHICKPWHYLCQHPSRHDYRDARARTPWGAARLDDQTVATRAIGRLPARSQVETYVRLLKLRHKWKQARARVVRRVRRAA
jgi:lipopolysaccharide biosynthesis glycosyltransferase